MSPDKDALRRLNDIHRKLDRIHPALTSDVTISRALADLRDTTRELTYLLGRLFEKEPHP